MDPLPWSGAYTGILVYPKPDKTRRNFVPNGKNPADFSPGTFTPKPTIVYPLHGYILVYPKPDKTRRNFVPNGKNPADFSPGTFTPKPTIVYPLHGYIPNPTKRKRTPSRTGQTAPIFSLDP
jgi:hypothetical protein